MLMATECGGIKERLQKRSDKTPQKSLDVLGIDPTAYTENQFDTFKSLIEDIKRGEIEIGRCLEVVNKHANAAVACAIEQGNRLQKLKESAKHGDFMVLVEKNTQLSHRTVERYMKLARLAKGNSTHVSNLLKKPESLRKVYLLTGIISAGDKRTVKRSELGADTIDKVGKCVNNLCSSLPDDGTPFNPETLDKLIEALQPIIIRYNNLVSAQEARTSETEAIEVTAEVDDAAVAP